ncbi:MAG: hypothetical protein WCS85_04875 [Candidatus Peribacteraceae bacterium]
MSSSDQQALRSDLQFIATQTEWMHRYFERGMIAEANREAATIDHAMAGVLKRIEYALGK